MGLGHSPNINTSSLVLAIDAGNVKSYPGTGTTWSDLSSNRRSLTLTNGPSFSYSFDGMITFDGTNDIATFTSVGVTNNLTIIAWIRTTSTDASATSAVPALPVVGDILNSIWYSFGVHGGKVRYYNAKKNGAWSFYDSTASVNDGNWHQIAVTHSKSGEIVSIYVDGNFDSSFSNDSAGSTNYWASYMNANRVGTSYGSSDFFQGDISMVLIYDALLSAADIKNHFSATRARFEAPTVVGGGLVLNLDAGNVSSYSGSGTSWLDLSGRSNNGTLINGPTFNSSNGGSIVFDGSNDYVNVPYASSLDTPTGATYEMWIYPTAGNAEFLSRGTSDSGATPDNPRFYCSNTGSIYFDWSRPGTDVWGDISGATMNAWNCVVVTAKPNENMKLYINSVFKGINGTGGTFQNVIPNTSDPIQIGAATWIPRYFGGRIAIVRLYNRVLDLSEIRQNYDAVRGRFGL